MKKLLYILFVFVGFVSKAQINYTPMNAQGYDFKSLKVRNNLIPPTDTTNYKDGVVVINAVIYVGNGEYWIAVAGTGTIVVGSATIDSVTFNNLQICTWFGGVSDCLDQNLVHANSTINYNGTKVLFYNLRGDLLPDSVTLPHTDVYEGSGITLTDTLGGAILISANVGGTTTGYQVQTAGLSTTLTFTSVPSSYGDYDIVVNGSILTPLTHYIAVGNAITMPGLKPGDQVVLKRKK